MENRKKFYSSGKWGSFKLNERYECVCNALNAYNDPNGFLDEQDLKFIIKNAFVSKIYVSEGVANAYPKYSHRFGILSGLYDDLVGAGVLDLQDHLPNLSCKYLELSELGPLVYTYKKNGMINKNEPSIRIEHVVPAKVYLGDVKEKYAHKMFTFDYFKKVFDAVSICLVTKEEDKKLGEKRRNSKGKREYTLVSNMPRGYEDFISYPFARYDKKLGGAGIEIHGWTMKDGRLEEELT